MVWDQSAKSTYAIESVKLQFQDPENQAKPDNVAKSCGGYSSIASEGVGGKWTWVQSWFTATTWVNAF